MKRIVQEIIKQANIEEYESLLRSIIDRIHKRGFNLYCRYESEQSVVEWSNKIIRISVKSAKQKGIKIIWDILHELGHLIDGKPLISGPDLQREINAWQNAERIFKEIPDLDKYYLSFVTYKNECLDTYKFIN
jgi:hypothetical protein